MRLTYSVGTDWRKRVALSLPGKVPRKWPDSRVRVNIIHAGSWKSLVWTTSKDPWRDPSHPDLESWDAWGWGPRVSASVKCLKFRCTGLTTATLMQGLREAWRCVPEKAQVAGTGGRQVGTWLWAVYGETVLTVDDPKSQAALKNSKGASNPTWRIKQHSLSTSGGANGSLPGSSGTQDTLFSKTVSTLKHSAQIHFSFSGHSPRAWTLEAVR